MLDDLDREWIEWVASLPDDSFEKIIEYLNNFSSQAEFIDLEDIMEQKTCTKCKLSFPATVEYFYKNKRNKRCGLESQCRSCRGKAVSPARQKINAHKWYEAHKEEYLDRVKSKRQEKALEFLAFQESLGISGDALRRMDKNASQKGITWQQYFDTRDRQDSRCAICLIKEDSFNGMGKYKMLYIDHDHVTNLVRGLLCPSCNLLLGAAKDNPDILEKAATYLRNPPGVVDGDSLSVS